jgi:hypothetical protein
VIALWSDNVLILMVLRVEWVVVTGPLAPVLLASSGTAVAGVLEEDDDAELVDIEEEDGVEFNGLDDTAEELNCEEEEEGTLAMGWLLVPGGTALLVLGDPVDMGAGGWGVPLDDAFDRNAGLKAMENAFAAQAQAQLQAWGGARPAELAAGIELFADAGTTSTTIVEVPPGDCT